MEKLLPVLISTIALVVTIIAQRDKLLSFLDELDARRVQISERKKAMALVAKFATPEQPEQKNSSSSLNRFPAVLYVTIILLFVLSSAILSYLGDFSVIADPVCMMGLLSAGVFYMISLIVGVTSLLAYRRLNSQTFEALRVGVALLTSLWASLVILIELIGLRMMWSGVIAGVISTLIIWSVEHYAVRRK